MLKTYIPCLISFGNETTHVHGEAVPCSASSAFVCASAARNAREENYLLTPEPTNGSERCQPQDCSPVGHSSWGGTAFCCHLEGRGSFLGSKLGAVGGLWAASRSPSPAGCLGLASPWHRSRLLCGRRDARRRTQMRIVSVKKAKQKGCSK